MLWKMMPKRRQIKIEDEQDLFTGPARLTWHTAGSNRKTKQIRRFKCEMASMPSWCSAVFNSYFLFSQQLLGSQIIILMPCSHSIFMLYEVCCHQSLASLSRPIQQTPNAPLGAL